MTIALRTRVPDVAGLVDGALVKSKDLVADGDCKLETNDEPQEEDGRVPLDVTELHRATTIAAWAAILKRDAGEPKLFRFGDHQIVRVDGGTTGRPFLKPLLQEDFRNELDQRIACSRVRRSGEVRCYPPPTLAMMMRHDTTSPLPILRGLITVPVFTEAGLRTTPGYSSSDKLILVPDFTPMPVPDNPSPSDVAAAKQLLDELLVDFPFAASADKANAIGLALLPFVRDLIPGPTPLHLVEAPVPGAGKGLLVDALLTPALGLGGISSVALPSEAEETRKLITTLLIEGRPAVNFDNAVTIGSPVLSKALTDVEWSDRRLGENKGERLPVRVIWVATANNPGVSAEIARRVVPIRLTPDSERPGERTNFRHWELRAWMVEARPRLVWALHVLAMRWRSRGSPGPDDRVPMLGSFEAWRRVIGGILATAEINGFLGNRERFRDDAEIESSSWQEFVELWARDFGGNPTTVGQLMGIAIRAELHLPGSTDGERQRKLGYLLRDHRDRVYGGYRINKAGEKKALRRKWCLVQVGGQRELFPDTPAVNGEESPF